MITITLSLCFDIGIIFLAPKPWGSRSLRFVLRTLSSHNWMVYIPRGWGGFISARRTVNLACVTLLNPELSPVTSSCYSNLTCDPEVRSDSCGLGYHPLSTWASWEIMVTLSNEVSRSLSSGRVDQAVKISLSDKWPFPFLWARGLCSVVWHCRGKYPVPRVLHTRSRQCIVWHCWVQCPGGGCTNVVSFNQSTETVTPEGCDLRIHDRKIGSGSISYSDHSL